MGTDAGSVYLFAPCNIDTMLTNNGSTLVTNHSGASYKGLNCNDNYSIIFDETSNIFTPTINGEYAVEITSEGCVDTSVSEMVYTVGIESRELRNNVHVYPNPTDGKITVLIESLENTSISVFNSLGKLILAKQSVGRSFEFDINSPKGIYILKAQSGGPVQQFKIVKY